VRSLVVVMLVACSAPPAPPAAPAPARTVVKAGPPAPVTCGDVGVILRGPVEDDRSAGPMKEAAIAQACLHDQWSAEIRACIGGTPAPKTCLAQLAQAQRVAYQAKLERWADDFPEEQLDEEATDEDQVAFIDCATAVGDASQYAPVLVQKGAERELAVALRRQQLLALCDDWTNEARKCFDQVKRPEQCRGLLEPDQQQDLVDRLAEVDVVMAKVAGTKPPTCKRVVELHYADAQWKGKLDALKPGEKKKIVIESRKRMREACTAEKWTDSVRSCIAVGGGSPCFLAAGMSVHAWGFPPSAVPLKTGIPECDAYADTLRALAGCNQIPRQAAQAMLDAYQQTAPVMANLPANQRTAAASSCKQADSAIRQSAQSLGCTI
jgi:hypothetical protein